MQGDDIMNKNVVILSSSPRKGGNSEKLATAFAKGVEEMGNRVEIVYLREKQYSFCKGCFACQKLGRWSLKTTRWKLQPKCMMPTY